MNDNPTIKRVTGIVCGYKTMKKDGEKYFTDGHGNADKIYWTIGEEKRIEQLPILCDTGFHFFRHLCFAINYFGEDSHIFEVEGSGDIFEDTEKLVCNKIKVLRKLSEKEIQKNVNGKNNAGNRNAGDGNAGNGNAGDGNAGNGNAGDGNAGYGNAGDRNVGDGNAGYRNAGDGNAGNRNAGDGNAGNGNAGDGNAGYRNAGNRNAGYGNAGNRNAGNGNAGYRNAGNGNAGDGNAGNRNAGSFNSCNFSSGVFNSIERNILIFNKPSKLTMDDWRSSKQANILGNFCLLDGKSYKESFIEFWNKLSSGDKKCIRELPNFDKKVFFEITGVKVEK